ncbi:hypothetical protein J4407_03040 [Candidatus Pacearchaeota archaeon]|nr:hypothetical protein [Candidatus Pacearchaeota archaeon]
MKIENLKGFDIVGNIAILKFSRNMKGKEKKKIAEKLLKKNPTIKTVLEKTGKFKGRLRKQQTKHLLGIKTKEALYRENECVFRFNVDKTYFSPRLSNERKEIASKIKKSSKVLVMFAGVAPYSIVIAKKSKAKVYSAEINKEASKYAKLNVELNKLKDNVQIIQGDIRKTVKKILAHSRSQINKKISKQNYLLNKNYVESRAGRRLGVISNRVSDNERAIKGGVIVRGTLVPHEFDFIVMPRPQLKESFLKEAFSLSKKNTVVFYYDFCKEEEIPSVKKKINEEAKKSKKKIKILNVKKAGEIAPYKFRVRIDFKVL